MRIGGMQHKDVDLMTGVSTNAKDSTLSYNLIAAREPLSKESRPVLLSLVPGRSRILATLC